MDTFHVLSKHMEQVAVRRYNSPDIAMFENNYQVLQILVTAMGNSHEAIHMIMAVTLNEKK